MFTLPTSTTKDMPRTLTLDVIAGAFFLTIRQRLSGKREECDKYTITEIGSTMGGRGFELTRITPDEDAVVYHVLADGPRSTCDCRGFQRHQHCKHSGAILKLIERGDLPATKPTSDPMPKMPDGAALSHDGKNYWIGAECYTLDRKFLFALENA